jgi:hypothetical protein
MRKITDRGNIRQNNITNLMGLEMDFNGKRRLGRSAGMADDAASGSVLQQAETHVLAQRNRSGEWSTEGLAFK